MVAILRSSSEAAVLDFPAVLPKTVTGYCGLEADGCFWFSPRHSEAVVSARKISFPTASNEE
jgi:hypothetical protein